LDFENPTKHVHQQSIERCEEINTQTKRRGGTLFFFFFFFFMCKGWEETRAPNPKRKPAGPVTKP
jgi:hypothetical protein